MTEIPIQLSKGALREGRHDRHAFTDMPRNPVYIAMDSLTCSHNVGCVFRMADAVLAKKLLLCGDTRLPPSKRISKGSAKDHAGLRNGCRGSIMNRLPML